MLSQLRVVVVSAMLILATGAIASADEGFLQPHAPPRPPIPTHAVTLSDVLRAQAGGWRRLTAPCPFGQNGAGTPILLTDGTVMVSDNTSHWFRLIPDAQGDYVDGTWKQAASMPPGYGPLYFASAVLADGKLVVEGGEYNFFKTAETNRGAIYDPVADSWTPIAPPSGWTSIGDASSVVLPDGTFMLGNCCYATQALLDESTLTWTLTGHGKADRNSEEGWTLLPDGDVLTADVIRAPLAELFGPSRHGWFSAGDIPVNLTQQGEIGPQILRPDGTVFVAGADQHTAIYQSHRRAWIPGPDFPVIDGAQVDVADGPATLFYNGSVLMAASPGVYHTPMSMLVFDGNTIRPIIGPPNAQNDSSYNVRLLMLPDGDVLETDASDDVEIYRPRLPHVPTVRPTITSFRFGLTRGRTYKIAGTLFNGLSQANAYGDDAQSATNFPIVRIQSAITGRVVYARTHDHSFMGVASPATVTTLFDVPPNADQGASLLEVIVNGVASEPVAVHVH